MPYNDSPGNGAELIDKKGQQYDISIGGIEPDISSHAKIAPGDARLGFITFEAPKGDEVTHVQFTLESGFGPETGEWLL